MPRSLFSRSASGVLKGENEVGGDSGDEDALLSVFCLLARDAPYSLCNGAKNRRPFLSFSDWFDFTFAQ